MKKSLLQLLLIFFLLTPRAYAADDPADLVKAATEKKEAAIKERTQLLTAAKLALELAEKEEKADAKAAATAEFKKKAAAADAAAKKVELADAALRKATEAATAAAAVTKDIKEADAAAVELSTAKDNLKKAQDQDKETSTESTRKAVEAETQKLKDAAAKAAAADEQVKKSKATAKSALEEARLAGFKVDEADKEEEDDKKKDEATAKEFSPFRLWVGTNLDLLDGVKTAKLYGNVDFTTPLGTNENHVLLGFGVFQNRSVSVDSTRRPAFATDRNFRAPLVRDSIDVVQTNYINTPKLTTTNLGFYSLIGVRLLSTGERFKVTGMNTTVNTVNIYLALRTEIIRRENSTKNKYEIITRDTTRRALVNGRYTFRPLAPDRTANQLVSVIQFGAPIFLVTESLEARFTPMVGWSFQDNDHTWVGSMSFNITEKALGLSIGGEARTIFKGEPALMNLYIAKSFTIKDFKDLVKFN